MRNTLQKEFVLNNLSDRHDHPSAYQIFDGAKKADIKIGVTSIYRILNQLVEDEKVCKLITKDNVAHYDYIRNDHIHLICNNCGKIIDIPKNKVFIDDVNKNLQGFKLNMQDITFYGECENCKTIVSDKYKNK